MGTEHSAAPVSAAPAWSPTVVVPAGGISVWDAADPMRAPVARIPEGIRLGIVARNGDFAQVRDVSGWTGWVDCRLLLVLPPPEPQTVASNSALPPPAPLAVASNVVLPPPAPPAVAPPPGSSTDRDRRLKWRNRR